MIEASGIIGEGGEPKISTESIRLEESEELATQIVRFVARTGDAIVVDDAAHDSRFASDPYLARTHACSILCFPLLHREEIVEIVYLESDARSGALSIEGGVAERAAAVRALATQAAAALENARLHQNLKQTERALRRALDELDSHKNRLEAENVYLQKEIGSRFEEIVGESEAVRRMLYKIDQVAATDATVLILGETGTGKELVARGVHRLSPRRERPLVKVNCAALPAALIESELFGHEKGAFTGALTRKTGRFELADSGTLFLDEVGDLPLELQAKLLRVLQEGEFERLGGARTIRVDVRIIAATNRDLRQAMEEGTFRSDLYYRLAVFPIEPAPLRERAEDIPLLARHFIAKKQGKLGRRVDKISRQTVDSLVRYDWPGNIRELENVIERALILSPGDTLHLDESFHPQEREPREASSPAADEMKSLAEHERAHILEALETCSWKIKGPSGAAHRLGIAPSTLRDRMKRHGIARG